MRVRGVIAVLIMFIVPGLAHAESLRLKVGERKSFAIVRAAGVLLDRPHLADVELLGTERLVVIGRRPGRTLLDVFTHDGRRIQYMLVIMPARAARTDKSLAARRSKSSMGVSAAQRAKMLSDL